MAVITISRQAGSWGDEIAQQLSQELGYRLFNKQMVMEAAMAEGISSQDILDYSEENYRVRGFMERLFGGTALAASYAGFWMEDAAAAESLVQLRFREEEALELMRKTIRAACEAGNIIIAGRGGQVILQDQPGVISARVVAPFEERARRVAEQMAQDLPALDPAQRLAKAREMIRHRDLTSADYLKRFYEVDWSDPTLYHLVINTARVSICQAVEQIRLLVER